MQPRPAPVGGLRGQVPGAAAPDHCLGPAVLPRVTGGAGHRNRSVFGSRPQAWVGGLPAGLLLEEEGVEGEGRRHLWSISSTSRPSVYTPASRCHRGVQPASPPNSAAFGSPRPAGNGVEATAPPDKELAVKL